MKNAIDLIPDEVWKMLASLIVADNDKAAPERPAHTRSVATDAVANEPKLTLDPAPFFSGKTYRAGLAAYEKALATHNAGLAVGAIGDMAYLASPINGKPNQYERREGYLLCCNVPFCRSGFMDYSGSELKRHKDYKPAWGLDDNATYPVYRSIAEVTNQRTLCLI